MSMTRIICGFSPPDETWHQMKAVYDACKIAKIPVPDVVLQFFDYENPDPEGVKIDLIKKHPEAVREWFSEYGTGYEVNLEKLSKHVRIIRFFTC